MWGALKPRSLTEVYAYVRSDPVSRTSEHGSFASGIEHGAGVSGGSSGTRKADCMCVFRGSHATYVDEILQLFRDSALEITSAADVRGLAPSALEYVPFMSAKYGDSVRSGNK